MSKTRSDSVLDGLPLNQKEVIERWLFEENLSYDRCVDLLKQDFGVRSSRSALERFFKRVSQRRLLERIKSNASQANELGTEFRKSESPMPEVVVKLVTQLAFEHLAGGANVPLDKGFIVKLTKLAVDSGLKAKKLELDERKIDLLEAKAKQADEARAAMGDSKLSAQEREQRMRQIFGLT